MFRSPAPAQQVLVGTIDGVVCMERVMPMPRDGMWRIGRCLRSTFTPY
jgi:hypothetical protein